MTNEEGEESHRAKMLPVVAVRFKLTGAEGFVNVADFIADEHERLDGPAKTGEKSIDKMNKGELVAYAEKLGLTIADDASKAEIVEAIAGAGT